MTIGEFKKVIGELECSDDLLISVQYYGGDTELTNGDCFRVKDFEELTDKAIYLSI